MLQISQYCDYLLFMSFVYEFYCIVDALNMFLFGRFICSIQYYLCMFQAETHQI